MIYLHLSQNIEIDFAGTEYIWLICVLQGLNAVYMIVRVILIVTVKYPGNRITRILAFCNLLSDTAFGSNSSEYIQQMEIE